MAEETRRLGLKVMVGNMLGTSLAMAPAFLVGQLCAVCVGEYALPEATITTGLPRLTPSQAYTRGARALVIGVAFRGGDEFDALVEACLTS